jgi:capsule polysaccharide export protein KpsC/LpsZ
MAMAFSDVRFRGYARNKKSLTEICEKVVFYALTALHGFCALQAFEEIVAFQFLAHAGRGISDHRNLAAIRHRSLRFRLRHDNLERQRN